LLLNEDRFEVHFRPGENIIKQGTTLTHITNLISGLAKTYIEGYNQRNLLLSLVGGHTILGGPGLFTDNRNHYTVTALDETIVCFINVDNFKNVLRSNKIFAEKFIGHLNQKTIFTFNKILSLTPKADARKNG
jgi:CRP-like cAMP-binding protein